MVVYEILRRWPSSATNDPSAGLHRLFRHPLAHRMTSQMLEGAASVGVFCFIPGSVNHPWNVAGYSNAPDERGLTCVPRGIFNNVTPPVRCAQKTDRAQYASIPFEQTDFCWEKFHVSACTGPELLRCVEVVSKSPNPFS